MKVKKIIVPSGPDNRVYVRRKNRRARKRRPTPPHLTAVLGPLADALPTLVFKRRYPSSTYVVPAVKIPMYWFDQVMITKRWIIPIPPDTFIVDGRRFKVLAQDRKEIGRYGYTRWLVFEELAVGKGNKP